MTVFIGGKQKRVRRPPTIEGVPADEFIARNADPIWLHQNEMWELIPFEVDAYAARSHTIDEHEAHFDEYLDDLARWEEEADFCDAEDGFVEEESEPSSDFEEDDLPF